MEYMPDSGPDIRIKNDTVNMSARLDFRAEDTDAELTDKIQIGSTVHDKVFEYDLKHDGKKVYANFLSMMSKDGTTLICRAFALRAEVIFLKFRSLSQKMEENQGL